MSVLRDATLSARFDQITALLQAGENFWRQHAFKYLQLNWEKEFPALSQALHELPLDTAEKLARNDAQLHVFLSAYSPIFSRIGELCALDQFDEPPLPDIEPRDIPGRKWQQLRHFFACVPNNHFALLEWCAGKAHLGRTLAQQRGGTLTALEFNPQLIEAGKKLAAREKIAIDFRCVDVMSSAAITLLQKNHNAIALHACGDLHLQLLRVCAQQQTAAITLAPCCYHLLRDPSHYLLSNTARASGLNLQADDLRTAVHGTVTASARENRQRQHLQAWRLGFDLLQRDVRGRDEYFFTPSLALSVLNNGFAAFCRTVAELRQFELPTVVDYGHYERAGHARLRLTTALDLPRIAFRRALELWLVLDRALFLREQGYDVAVGTFCPPALTPRNLLIQATLPQNP